MSRFIAVYVTAPTAITVQRVQEITRLYAAFLMGAANRKSGDLAVAAPVERLYF
jgi:hypothetical protein